MFPGRLRPCCLFHAAVGPVAERLDHVGRAAGEQQLGFFRGDADRRAGRSAASDTSSRRTARSAAWPPARHRARGCVRGAAIIVAARRRGGEPVQFLVEAEQPEIGHAHGVEDPVQVVVFVLHDRWRGSRTPRVPPRCRRNPRRDSARAGARGTPARMPGIDRQPSQFSTRSSLSSSSSGLISTPLPTGRSSGSASLPVPGDAEHEQPQRDIHLRRGEADARCVLHGLDHVCHQAADAGRPGRAPDRNAAAAPGGPCGRFSGWPCRSPANSIWRPSGAVL